MKNVEIVDSTPGDDHDELLPEYRFDYRNARPNRFVGNVPVAVVLDDDVAKVYNTSELVNSALRQLMSHSMRES